MKTVNISDLRANLLKYLEKVHAGEQISVTSNGKYLATLVPPVSQKTLSRKHLQALAATARMHDIISPVDSHWDVLS